MAQVHAPWSDEQVAALVAWQSHKYVHPFTSEKRTDLIPTASGWVEHEGGPIVQTWAHDFMLDKARHPPLR